MGTDEQGTDEQGTDEGQAEYPTRRNLDKEGLPAEALAKEGGTIL
jgi:hypothetical protein